MICRCFAYFIVNPWWSQSAVIYPLKKVKGQRASVGHILPSERKWKDVSRRITSTVLSRSDEHNHTGNCIQTGFGFECQRCSLCSAGVNKIWSEILLKALTPLTALIMTLGARWCWKNDGRLMLNIQVLCHCPIGDVFSLFWGCDETLDKIFFFGL